MSLLFISSTSRLIHPGITLLQTIYLSKYAFSFKFSLDKHTTAPTWRGLDYKYTSTGSSGKWPLKMAHCKLHICPNSYLPASNSSLSTNRNGLLWGIISFISFMLNVVLLLLLNLILIFQGSLKSFCKFIKLLKQLVSGQTQQLFIIYRISFTKPYIGFYFIHYFHSFNYSNTDLSIISPT